MNKIISSRYAILKFVLGTEALHLGLTMLSKFYKENSVGGRLMTIREYVHSTDVRENAVINLMGTVRPYSISYEPGTFKKKFTLTDSKYNLECTEEGISKFELSEGESIMLKGYCPDIKSKLRIVVKEYSTRHGMEVKEWVPKENISKKGYGIQAYS